MTPPPRGARRAAGSRVAVALRCVIGGAGWPCDDDDVLVAVVLAGCVCE